MRRRHGRRIVLATATLSMAFVVGLASASGAQAPATLPATHPVAAGGVAQQADPDLLAAIAEYAQFRDHAGYAGDCQTVQYPDDLHKECSSIMLVTDGVARVGISEAFTDGGNWVVFVRLSSAGWLEVAEVPGCVGYAIPADGIANVSVQVNGQWLSAATVLPYVP